MLGQCVCVWGGVPLKAECHRDLSFYFARLCILGTQKDRVSCRVISYVNF